METITNKPTRFSVSQLMQEEAPNLIQAHTLCPEQLKAIDDMISCRSARLKGHVSRCTHCGHYEQSYNSCRNRHCNKCQFIKQTIWVDKLKSKLLPVRYFHVVFTMPSSLNKLFYINQRLCYDILFKSAWYALNVLCSSTRFLGAQVGAVAILHTWTSTLQYHPHIHFLVTAGGLNEDNQEWIKAKSDYLLPVKVLSKVYRGRCSKLLCDKLDKKHLRLPDGLTQARLKQMIFEKQWVVYAKKTGKNPQYAIDYLARYTHRVAIANSRIVNVAKGKVTFRYKNPQTGQYNKEMTLTTKDFVRRFLMHILPSGFYKVRYFGLLASVNTKTKAEQCYTLINKTVYLPQYQGLSTYEVLRLITATDISYCKICKTGRMIPVLHIEPG